MADIRIGTSEKGGTFWTEGEAIASLLKRDHMSQSDLRAVDRGQNGACVLRASSVPISSCSVDSYCGDFTNHRIMARVATLSDFDCRSPGGTSSGFAS